MKFEFKVDRGYYTSETFWAEHRNGTTVITDCEDTQIAVVSGTYDAGACCALIEAYAQGRSDGKDVGKREFQHQLRTLLGAAAV